MASEHLLAAIGKAIIGAGLIGFPFFYLGIPLILGYLIAGVLLGPNLGFGIIQNSNSISNISEIGLVLLLFILGLEINLKKLLQTGRVVLIAGISQVIGTFALGLLFFYFFVKNNNGFELVYLAVACSLSSTLLVVKILSDQMDLDSAPSRITLGILVIQDLFAIGFLALQPNLSNLAFGSLLLSFGKVVILVFTTWFFAKYLLPIVFKKSGRQPELMLILAMAWCFGVCGLADYLNLSLEMGALVAGISIASFPYHLDIAAKIASLRDFFITLFFVSLGLQIPMPSFEVIKLTILILFFIFMSRIIIIYPILYRLGYANRASLLPTINLSQISEFAIVLGTLGITYKHISTDILSAFILAMVIAALVSSVMIPRAHTIYIKLNSLLEMVGFRDYVNVVNATSEPSQKFNNYSIVILGFYRESSSLLYEINSKFSQDFIRSILVVDFNPEVHKELTLQGYNCRYGDISSIDTLRSLNLDNTKMIICTLPDKTLKGTTNFKILSHLKQLAPNSCKIVTAENSHYALQLYAEGADYVFIPRIISANYLVEVVERLQVNGSHTIRAEAQEHLKNRAEIIH